MVAQHLNKALPEGETRKTPQTALKGLRVVDVGCGGGILAEVGLGEWPEACALLLTRCDACTIDARDLQKSGRAKNPSIVWLPLWRGYSDLPYTVHRAAGAVQAGCSRRGYRRLGAQHSRR